MNLGTFATYDAWKAAAVAADERSGAERWKNEDRTDLYDYRVIRFRHDELVGVRESGDPHRLLYYLNEGMHGNMGGMGAPALYAKCRFGTKKLVTDYIGEVVAALEQLAAVDERRIKPAEKLALFRRASDCFGRSALMLSGAGSLGPFHMGVVKALAEQGLLPNVISGASAGSVVAAIAGTHSPDRLPDLFAADSLAERFRDFAQAQQASARQISIDGLTALVEAWVPDLTFVEALEESGLKINVSVAPSEPQQRSRLLNAATSPNVFVRDAVLASCAIPGVFRPVTLSAKDSTGHRRPYVPSRRWVDGSITGDLPARRLARLYGVNHFITSQTNPVVLWALQDPNSANNLPARLMSIYQSATRDWLRAIYPFVMESVRNVYPMNTFMRIAFSVMTQEYTADVNILPRRRLVAPAMLLAPLSLDQTRALIRDGETATWPKIEMIRNCTRISSCIDRLRGQLEDRLMSA